jgi:hypothetical protein
MTDDLERELTRAMAADVANLTPPQLDLRRIHRRPVRRLALPGAVVAVAVAAAAPFAAAGTGVLDRSPVSAENDVAPAVPLTTTATLPRLSPAPPSIKVPRPPVETGKDRATCVSQQHTFSTEERAAAVRQLRAAAAALSQRALGAGPQRRVVLLTLAELDRLLPKAGATVTYRPCLPPGRVVSAAQRAAALAEVRRAAADVETAVLGARKALEQAFGEKELPSWLGDLEVTVVSRTADRLVLRIAFGQPKRGWPLSGSITVVVRLPDRTVVAVDTSRLTLPPGLSVPRPPLPLPPVPLPVPSPPEVPGLPTGGR